MELFTFEKDVNKKYIEMIGGNWDELTKNEMKIIHQYNKSGQLEIIEFNKKGHLVFRQRYPLFPLYFSIFSLVISMLSWAYVYFCKYVK